MRKRLDSGAGVGVWVIASAMVFASGCSHYEARRAPGFNPLTRRVVAVMPFEASYHGRNFPTGAIDRLPGVSGVDGAKGENYFRHALITILRRAGYRILSPAYVDAALAQAGFGFDGRFRDLSPRRMGELLKVDAVLYGEVPYWDIGYYVFETRYRVGCRVRLMDAHTGELLIESNAVTRGGRGVTGGPMGGFDLFFEPLRGLGSDNLMALGLKSLEQLCKPFLATEEDVAEARRRAPEIRFVTHDWPDGEPLVRGAVVTILAEGDPGATATWRLDGSERDSSLCEVAPGIYVGKFAPPPGVAFPPAYVTVEMVSEGGFRSAMRAAKPLSCGQGRRRLLSDK